MAPPVSLHIFTDELVNGVGLTSKVIDPTVALECCPSNGTDVFLPPQFPGNEEPTAVGMTTPSSGLSMAMNSIVLVEVALPKFHAVEAEGSKV